MGTAWARYAMCESALKRPKWEADRSPPSGVEI
jgi:hypothetical protein